MARDRTVRSTNRVMLSVALIRNVLNEKSLELKRSVKVVCFVHQHSLLWYVPSFSILIIVLLPSRETHWTSPAEKIPPELGETLCLCSVHHNPLVRWFASLLQENFIDGISCPRKQNYLFWTFLLSIWNFPLCSWGSLYHHIHLERDKRIY